MGQRATRALPLNTGGYDDQYNDQYQEQQYSDYNDQYNDQGDYYYGEMGGGGYQDGYGAENYNQMGYDNQQWDYENQPVNYGVDQQNYGGYM